MRIMLTVYIQYAFNFSIKYQRQYYLGPGQTAACNMPGKGFNVRYDKGFGFSPAASTNSTTLADTCARHRSLERPKHKLFAFYQIESDPPPIELFLQSTGNIRQVSDQIRLAFH